MAARKNLRNLRREMKQSRTDRRRPSSFARLVVQSKPTTMVAEKSFKKIRRNNLRKARAIKLCLIESDKPANKKN